MKLGRNDITAAKAPAKAHGPQHLPHAFFKAASPKPPWDDTVAIREALFSVERLELARAQTVKPYRQLGYSLLDRLADNETSLVQSYRSICSAIVDKAAITPAAEWLIDNFNLVERQIREVRLDFPRLSGGVIATPVLAISLATTAADSGIFAGTEVSKGDAVSSSACRRAVAGL